MTDEERLIEAVMKTINSSGVNDAWARAAAKARIELLRRVGITMTLLPAPEPTYRIQFSDKQRSAWMTEFAMHDPPVFESHPLHSLWLAITEATPDDSATE